MHSVLWEGTKKEEEAFRRIMVAAVSGQLEGKLAGIIHPDPRKGFDYEDAPLCAIGALGTSLKTSPDEEARSCLFADGSAFLDKVQTHRLPELPFKKLCPERGGLLVAVAAGFPQQALESRHPYLRWILNAEIPRGAL